jgi:hypothetical protein
VRQIAARFLRSKCPPKSSAGCMNRGHGYIPSVKDGADRRDASPWRAIRYPGTGPTTSSLDRCVLVFIVRPLDRPSESILE